MGASPTLEWLYILEGDATAEGGAYNPFYDYQSAGGGVAAIGTFDGDDSFTMRHCVIAGNIASQAYNASGGGIYLHYRNNAVLENNAIYSNTATLLYGQALGLGGGLNISSSDNVRFDGNAVHHNRATTGYGRGEGAGLRASSSDNLRIIQNEIYQNLGNDNGGGIHLRICNAALIQDNRIYDNVGATQNDGLGGGINLFSLDAPVIQNNEINDNVGTQSTSSEHVGIGGGMYLNDVDHAVVSGNVISGNVAHMYHTGTGGGVATFQCPNVTLDRNRIMYNVATPNHATNETAGGGGVRLSTRGTGMGGTRDTYASLTNNVIARNQAPYGGGGLILLSLSDGSHVYATLSHNTIADNDVPPTQAFSWPRAAQRGTPAAGFADYAHAELWALTSRDVSQVPIEAQAIMVIRGVVLDATNNVLSGHTRGVYVYEAAENTLAFDYTLWHENTNNHDPSVGHTHDRSGDPAYVDPSMGDYHIGATSAARDQGTDAGVTVDIDGETRPQGGGYDIGADEYTE